MAKIANVSMSGNLRVAPSSAPPPPPPPPAPVASFTASPTSGTAPLAVNFTDTSTNTPTSWAWDFKNDGTATSTLQNPSYTYSTAGNYTVKLTATNSGGSNTSTQSNLISVASAVPENFNLVTLQLPGTGTNNATNNTFLDSSTNNFTVTRVGNTTQGSYSPFSTGAGYWSNYFDGTGDYLSAPSNTAFSFGTGDFTVEGWFYLGNAANAYRAVFYLPHTNGTLQVRFGDTTSYGSYFQVSVITTAAANVYSANFTQSDAANKWTHFAFTRSGTTCRLFINGTQQNLGTGTNPSTFPNASFENSTSITSNAAVGIGESIGASIPWIGYLSNMRVVKGTALYTANFTPSTTPLTAVSGTSLLTCQSNRFVDNSSNAFAITKAGDTRVSGFGPFVPTSIYDSATMGGSMSFDGSGDYLTAPTNAALNLGTGDFTIEAWVYINSGQTGGAAVVGTGAFGPYLIYFNGAQSLVFYAGTSSGWAVDTLVITSSLTIGTWNHIAVTRSGTTFSSYINGNRANTATSSASLTSGATTNIGYYSASLNGYISGLRIIKGTALYTDATYTVPTSAPTAISGTSLLLNGANGAIVDASTKTVLETLGDAKISTTVSASGSIYLDGTGDYLTAPTSDNFGYGTGDFTIECWAYMNTITGDNTIISNLSGAASVNPHIFRNGGAIVYYTNSGERIRSTSSIAAQTWTHIAICRASGSTRLFLNGVQSGSTYADTNNYGSTAPLGIGTYWSGGSPVGSSTLNGYLNDVRISKGLARYTTTFTPPTRS